MAAMAIRTGRPHSCCDDCLNRRVGAVMTGGTAQALIVDMLGHHIGIMAFGAGHCIDFRVAVVDNMAIH